MSFWTYMIQCADRYFYVGHTEDLDVRIAQHQAGTFKGYTSAKRPVHLVWSEAFATRCEALSAERQIKGWRRDKKLALIRGDWAAISALARTAKEEGKASTSSARTDWGKVLGPVYLHPHPSQLPSQPFNLEVMAYAGSGKMKVRYRLVGEVHLLSVPSRAESVRRDGLWRHSCFEAFVRPIASEGYLEYNLSPSTEWAAYAFDAYREGMVALDVHPPKVTVSAGDRLIQLTAEIPLPPDFVPARIGLSAVLEETSGRKSYWALRHPLGDTPDFHHPDCFALELPSAGRP